MPRSGGGRSSGGRSSSGPSRSSSTSARVPATRAAPPPPPAPAATHAQHGQPGQRQPGLFANMASTAAGVAVGSSVGHAVSGMLFGGGGGHQGQQQEVPAQTPASNYEPTSYQTHGMYGSQQGVYGAASSCDVPAKDFTRCLSEQNGNMQACNWYLEQLKACQAAAAPY